VFQLLQATVQREGTVDGPYIVNLVQDLFELPAAQQLDRQAVLHLLQASLLRGMHEVTRLLCRLPAAQGLDRQTVLQLLQPAVQHAESSSMHSVAGLCSIPAAQQLTSQDVLQLLEAAVQRGSAESISPLCSLPAAQQLGREAVAELLRTAQQVGGIMGSECAVQFNLHGLLS
jgi:hypothetical protein